MPSLRVRPVDPAHGIPPLTAVEMLDLVTRTHAEAEVRHLVALTQRGDREAFGQIYDRYVDEVFALVLHRTGDRLVAEDLTSETFLRALKRIDCFTWQGADFGAWLTTIARNLVADHFKSHRVRFERPVADMRDADRADVHLEADPAQAAVDHITHLTLLTSVQELPELQRECIVLRFLKGLTITETAALMGRTEASIKMLQRRAMRALRVLVPASAVMA
jgi:RNA polymerase sigma-70 factor, ECF subfamily